MSKETECCNCRGTGEMFGGFKCDECNGTGIDPEKLRQNKLEAEILSLHSQLAHERLRADTGWSRYENANKQLQQYMKAGVE